MRQHAMFMTVALVLCCVGILAHSAEVVSLQLSCDPAEVCWGDELSVLASCENAGEAITVDIYLAVTLPSGDVFYFPDGSLSAPFISGVTIPESASFDDIEVFSSEMLPGLAAGEYHWMFAATTPGTHDVLAYSEASCRLGYDCWESYADQNNIKALLAKGDELFIGTCSSGITRLNITTGESENWGSVFAGLADTEVNDICVDGDGVVWAALGENYPSSHGGGREWGGISAFDGANWHSFWPTRGEAGTYWPQFRSSNNFETIFYSEADDAVYAFAPNRKDEYLGTSQIVKATLDGWEEVEIPIDSNNQERFWVGTVCPAVGSGISATFRSFDYYDWEWDVSLWEYKAGIWSFIIETEKYVMFNSSDSYYWSWHLHNRDPFCDSGYSTGLWRFNGEIWQEVVKFRDLVVFDVFEIEGRIHVLCADYILDIGPDYHCRLCSWNGSSWDEIELPTTWVRPCAAISDAGEIFFGGLSEGLFQYDGIGFVPVRFNSPRGRPLDACFAGEEAYVLSGGVNKLEGPSWNYLGADPGPSTSIFVDSLGQIWTFGNETWWGFHLYRSGDGETWDSFDLAEMITGAGPFVSMAEDATGAIWLEIAQNDRYTGDRICPVLIGRESGIQQYSDILPAIEANYHVLLESEAETGIWMVDKARGIVWVKWVVGSDSSIHKDLFHLGIGAFDGSEWTIYERSLPDGAEFIRFENDADNLDPSNPEGNRLFDTLDIPADMDPDGNIWTLTNRGLCRINLDGIWHDPSGRIDDFGPILLADDYGSVWVARTREPGTYSEWSCFQGLAKFDGNDWTNYTEHDVPICDWLLRMKSAPNGDVWFLTKDGATRYSQGPK